MRHLCTESFGFIFGPLPGQYHDTETGLHYNWHRYYDPATGRYLTSDPIGLEGGPNPYLYAEGNPLYFTDPEGLMAAQLIGGGVGFSVGFVANYMTGASFREAFVSGLQAGTAGFISGGGSLLMGFSTSVTVSLYSSHFSCGEVGFEDVGHALAMGGFAVAGGRVGGAVGNILRPVRMVEKSPGAFRRTAQRFFNVPNKKMDINKQRRVQISTLVGVASENFMASQYQTLMDQDE